MAELTRGQKRSEFILRAKIAFEQGMSQTSFLREARRRGISYRKTDMIADFHTVNKLERKKGALQFVRKDYYPTQKAMAQVTYDLTYEFMYVLKVRSRLEPGVDITERNINISSDIPMTPRMVEEKAWQMIGEQSPDKRKQVEEILPWTAMQRVSE